MGVSWVPRSQLHMGATFTIAPLSWVHAWVPRSWVPRSPLHHRQQGNNGAMVNVAPSRAIFPGHRFLPIQEAAGRMGARAGDAKVAKHRVSLESNKMNFLSLSMTPEGSKQDGAV